MSKRITAKFPAIFANDHYWRELPCGKLVDENSRYHTFLIEDGKESHEDRSLTAKEVLEQWASDADHYVEMDKSGGFDSDMKPLCRSAARTLRIANSLLAEHFLKPKGETKWQSQTKKELRRTKRG